MTPRTYIAIGVAIGGSNLGFACGIATRLIPSSWPWPVSVCAGLLALGAAALAWRRV